MDLPARLTNAMSTITAAMNRLEEAVARRGIEGDVSADLRTELDAAQADRTRLATALESSEERNGALRAAHDEVRQSLVQMAGLVRDLATGAERDAALHEARGGAAPQDPAP